MGRRRRGRSSGSRTPLPTASDSRPINGRQDRAWLGLTVHQEAVGPVDAQARRRESSHRLEATQFLNGGHAQVRQPGLPPADFGDAHVTKNAQRQRLIAFSDTADVCGSACKDGQALARVRSIT